MYIYGCFLYVYYYVPLNWAYLNISLCVLFICIYMGVLLYGCFLYVFICAPKSGLFKYFFIYIIMCFIMGVYLNISLLCVF